MTRDDLLFDCNGSCLQSGFTEMTCRSHPNFFLYCSFLWLVKSELETIYQLSFLPTFAAIAARANVQHGRRSAISVSEGSMVPGGRLVGLSEGLASEHRRSVCDHRRALCPGIHGFREQDGAFLKVSCLFVSILYGCGRSSDILSN